MESDIDDIIFEPKVGRAGRDRGSSLLKLRAAVRIAGRIGRGGGRMSSRTARAVSQRGPRDHFVKGASAAPRPSFSGQRRVVVKARFVSHAGSKGAPLRVHVAYLAREQRQASCEPAVGRGTGAKPELDRSLSYMSRETESGAHELSFYNNRESDLDGKALTSTWANDQRHFRLIISADDGPALGDLRPFIREVMAGLEAKAGTKLEWIAVDHHDTDNPHTHILIRGRRADGQELFIPRRLISSGIREHAQEIVTRALGPRLNVDIVKERFKDIDALGPSPIDRELARLRDRDGLVWPMRPDLSARLERLDAWGLASREAGGWRLAADFIGRLKAMATHARVQTIVGASGFDRRTSVVREAEHEAPSIGELVHFGPVDDLGETFLAIVESENGDLRYTTLDRAHDLAELDGVKIGATVTFEPRAVSIRPSDETIARVASYTGGVYSIDDHRAVAPGPSQAMMEANIRRLEAMRRAGLVESSADGVFTIQVDHLDRALRFEKKLTERSPLQASVQSHLTLREQVHAIGPTRLDRILSGAEDPFSGNGRVATAEAAALQQRRIYLIELGIMGRNDERLGGQAMAAMKRHELEEAARRASQELGIPVLTHHRASVQGVYAQRIDLAQGRMAIIVQDRQGFLVPWRPALERFASREVTGVARGVGLSWSLTSKRSPSLTPMG